MLNGVLKRLYGLSRLVCYALLKRFLAGELRIIRQSGCFDPEYYRTVQQLGDNADPILHYVVEGEARGAQPTLLFDPEWWKMVRSSRRRYNCFADYLTARHRQTISPSPYMVIRKDGDRAPVETSPLAAYLSSRGEAGLAPTPLFDSEFYLSRNADVRAVGVSPFEHFIFNGGREGRSPSACFDSHYYLDQYLGGLPTNIEPLRHFIMKGAARKYSPCRAIDPAFLVPRYGRDLLGALTNYQLHGRHEASAVTHCSLPPPGSRFQLLDDWPWENPREVDERGRVLMFVGRAPKNAEIDALSALATNSIVARLWIVAAHPCGRQLATRLNTPYLHIDASDVSVWVALIRAARQAGPHIDLVTLDPSMLSDKDDVIHRLDARFATLADYKPRSSAKRDRRTISVVIPSFNHARYLEQRIVTILAQRRRPCEIILIDDASTDDSANLAKTLLASSPIPSQVIARNSNSGNPARIWEQGAKLASGDLVWFAESDDMASPYLTERLGTFFDQDEEVMLAYCQSAILDEAGVRVADNYLSYTDPISKEKWLHPYITDGREEIGTSLAIKNTIPNASGVLMNRRAVKRVIMDVVNHRYTADWLVYLGLASLGKIAFTPEVLNFKRSHGVNLTDMGGADGSLLIETANIRERLITGGCQRM